jgi:hypothetical protein
VVCECKEPWKKSHMGKKEIHRSLFSRLFKNLPFKIFSNQKLHIEIYIHMIVLKIVLTKCAG